MRRKQYQDEYKAGKLQKPLMMNAESPDELAQLCLAWCKYAYGSYCSDETLVGFGGTSMHSGRSMTELRLYGRGAQGPQKYQKILDCEDENGEGYYNISWDTVKIYSKFRNLVRGKMDAIKFDFQTNSVDSSSRKEREFKKAKQKIAVNPNMQALIQATGVIPAAAREVPPGATEKDIDMMYKLGGQRLAHEMLMNSALMTTIYESRWEDTIRDMMIDDVIDIGIVAADTYIEKATGKVKAAYVDPEQLVAKASKYPDGRDRDFAGYFEDMTIGELRMRSGLSEKELYLIAKKYMGEFNNRASITGFEDSFTSRSFREDYMARKGNQIYDNFRVRVLHLYFISCETEKYIIGKHYGMGNEIYDKVDPDSTLDKKDIKRGKKMDEKTVQYVYSANWIIGTDHVFDYGIEYGVVRQGEFGNKRAVLPLKIWSYDGPSLTEACIGYIDDINIATFKKRNALSKLPPGPRMVLDKSKLRDYVTIGKDNYSILDITGIFQRTGILVVESKGEFNIPGMEASQSRPIDFVPTGLIEDINLFLQEIAVGIEGIRSVTGINEVADGSLSKDMLVGVASGLQAATNTSLRPYMRMYESIFRDCCQYWMLKWQVAVVNGEIDLTYTPIGEDTFNAARLTDNIMDYEFGIQLEILPNDEEKQMLLQHVFALWQNGGIPVDDYFVVENFVKTNQVKAAKLYISKAVASHMERMRAQEMDRIRANGEANAITVTATERAKAMTLQEETKASIAIEAAKHKNKIEQMMKEFELRMKEKGYDDGVALAQNIVAQ